MTAFAARVLRSIRTRRLLSPGERLGVAVSGGPDSTALLLVLLELAPSLGVVVDCVIHVNHGLRGAAADADAAAVAALAARLGVPFAGAAVDAADYARRHRCSIELAGHRLRRAAFAAIRTDRALDVVATGHTQDDQAETVLLRLVRGAGAHGLRGISPRSAQTHVVRPLLDTSRRDIERYLRARGASPRDDASNRDVVIPRNRIRHEVLPLLESRFSPRIREALARTATHLALDDDHFAPGVERMLGSVITTSQGLSLPATEVATAPAPVRRRVAQALLRRLGVVESARRIERLEAVLAGIAPGVVTIGPVSVSNSQGHIQLQVAGGRNAASRRGIEPLHPPPQVILEVGTPAAVGQWEVSAWPVDRLDHQPAAETLDADQVAWPLSVRTRRPGDRVRPLGGSGRRKVQDILVDRKVPRASRDTVPIVVDALDRIVWVAGHVLAHDVRVTATTTRMLLLTLRPAGGAV